MWTFNDPFIVAIEIEQPDGRCLIRWDQHWGINGCENIEHNSDEVTNVFFLHSTLVIKYRLRRLNLSPLSPILSRLYKGMVHLI